MSNALANIDQGVDQMKVYMKRPVTRTYQILLTYDDIVGFLSEQTDGEGRTSLAITSVDQAPNREDVLLRIDLVETSNT